MSLGQVMRDLVVPLVSVGFAFALGYWVSARRDARTVRSHIDALGMELRYCGELAATYLTENIDAPLYRQPRQVYAVALPLLLREGLMTSDQVHALQKFYLQVEQVNLGLDNVDDFHRGRTPQNEGQGITLAVELRRLRRKPKRCESRWMEDPPPVSIARR